MLEARRRAYMKAMGVVQYAPIAAIDGAKPSAVLLPEQVYPELVDSPVTDAAVVEVLPAESAGIPQARPPFQTPQSSEIAPPQPSQQLHGQVTAKDQRVALVEEKVPHTAPLDEGPPPTPDIKIKPLDDAASLPPEPAVQNIEKNLRFALTMVEIPGKLLVMADLADADAMGCSAMEYHLLQALLKSLMLDAEPSAHLFRWPLINNKRMVQGKAEAADGLQGFLMAKREKLQVPNLLLVGEYASAFMHEQETQSLIDFSGYRAQCFRIPSLREMLADWHYKPQAWAVLANLKAHLG